MSKISRRIVWWEVVALPTWRWVVLIPITIFGFYQLVRDEFLSPETAEKYKLPKLLPNISWLWWVAILLVFVIGILMESSYRALKTRENELTRLKDRLAPKFSAIYDRSFPSCDAIPQFVGGSHSRCIRLKVELVKGTHLAGCEAWLSIDRFPNVAPVRLFWAEGKGPMTVDLAQKIPRYVQVFRITDSNQIVPATEGEGWPIDSQNFPLGTYTFSIALKGHDEAETITETLRLEWTGNWRTAHVTDITPQSSSSLSRQ
jgi:hypothetical protein